MKFRFLIYVVLVAVIGVLAVSRFRRTQDARQPETPESQEPQPAQESPELKAAKESILRVLDQTQRNAHDNVRLTRQGSQATTNFNIKAFNTLLAATDRHDCPAEFQAAYDDFCRAMAGVVSYSGTAKAMDIVTMIRAFRGPKVNLPALPGMDKVQASWEHLCDCAGKYHADIRNPIL